MAGQVVCRFLPLLDEFLIGGKNNTKVTEQQEPTRITTAKNVVYQLFHSNRGFVGAFACSGLILAIKF